MRIVVLDGRTLNRGDLSWEDLAKLGDLEVFERTSPEEIVRRGQDAEIILTNQDAAQQECDRRHAAAAIHRASWQRRYNVVDTVAAREPALPLPQRPRLQHHVGGPARVCPLFTLRTISRTIRRR